MPKITRARMTAQRAHFADQQTRILIEWSPAMLKNARVQAEAGNFRLLSNLYDDLLGGDDRHHGTLASVAQKVLSFPITFDADGDRRRKTKIEEAAAEDFPRMCPLNEAVSFISQGLSLGFAVGQLLPWRPTRRGNRIAPRLTAINTACVRFDWPTRKWFVFTEKGEVEVTAGDGQWVLFLPYGADRPWMKGTWRACASWALLKRYAQKDWARQGELAGGIRTAKIDPKADTNDQDRRRLAADLAAMGSDGVCIPPPGIELAVLQTTSQTHKTFEDEIGTANSAIAVANKGESHTSGEGASGIGDSAGKTRKEVSDEKACFVAFAFEEFLADQLMTPYAQLNYGNEAPIPVPCFETEPPEDKAAKATTWKTAGEALAIWRSFGVRVDLNAAAEELGLVLLAEGEADPVVAPVVETPAEQATDTQPESKAEDKTDLAPTMPAGATEGLPVAPGQTDQNPAAE